MSWTCSFRIEYTFALDTTYHPNGGLADCQGHIHLDLDIVVFLFSLTFRLIIVKPWTQPILLMEDWLIVQSLFHPSTHFVVGLIILRSWLQFIFQMEEWLIAQD